MKCRGPGRETPLHLRKQGNERYGSEVVLMFTLTTNGKPFDPDDFEKAIMAAAVNEVNDHLHDQLSSIRHPRNVWRPTAPSLRPLCNR